MRQRFSTIPLLAGCLLLAAPVHSAYEGLWVGTATVDAMSRVNRATPDLSFDLALTTGNGNQVVASGATGWRYRAEANPGSNADPYTEPPADSAGTRWFESAFDDSAWSTGSGEFGYGEGDETTLLSYPTDTWPRTVYFRRAFTPGATGLETLALQLLCDDAAVVYLNGQEVFRHNLPVGQVHYDTAPATAVGPSEEGRYLVHEIDLVANPGLLRQTTATDPNVLAVEVHQHPGELQNPTLPTPTVTPSASAFNLRILLHNGPTSGAKLLKQVYRMTDADSDPAVPVLLASDARIPEYSGPGSRISTAAYDFEGDSVTCTGTPAAAGLVTCDLTLPANHPTNPFLHRYHPDHDNWDARYEKHYPEDAGAPEEAFTVERTLRFTFEAAYPPGCQGDECRQFPPPGWGDSTLGGTYTEILRGLHRDDITVSGTFELERVSTVSAIVE